MSGTSSIDGLVSGLDTTTIINQLVALERQPATQLASRQSDAKSSATAYSTVRGKVDAVGTALDALDLASDWNPIKATSSNNAAVSVSAGSTAAAGSLTVKVTSLAAAHSVVSTSAPLASDAAWATGDVTLHIDGVDHTITVPPNSTSGVRDLAAVTSAINGANLGVHAQAVQVSSGQYRLQITADETGAASEFSVVSGLAGTYSVATQGADASVEMAGGLYTATSSTNTFDELLPGIDLTVSQTTTDPVTITLTKDTDTLASRVQTLVNAVNGVITTIKSLTAYDATNNKASVLTGDSTVQRLMQDITQALLDPVAGSTTKLASFAGVTLAKDGTLSFDKAKFLDAYSKDPTGVQALFATSGDASKPSICDRLRSVDTAATAAGTGYLRTAEQMALDRADDYGKQIDAINDHADRQAEILKAQFAALETTLGTMKNQSAWLASQLAGLE